MAAYSRDRKAELARFRRALKGARWQFVESSRGLAWALLLGGGKRTNWLPEHILPDGPQFWCPDGLFYRYFGREVARLIDADPRRFKEFGVLIARSKIPIPDKPMMQIVRKAAS